MRQGKTVLEFIDRERLKGASDKKVLHTLLEAGWPPDIILKAMEYRPIENAVKEEHAPSHHSKISRFAHSR